MFTLWGRPSFQGTLHDNNIDIPIFSFFLQEIFMYAFLPLSPLEVTLNQI